MHEMTDEGQKRLLGLIASSKAKIIISGYDSEMYNEMLKGWRTDSTMSQTTSTEMAREKIWMNYSPPERQMTFEEITGEKDEK